MNTSLVAGTVLTLTELVGDYGAKQGNELLAFGFYNLLAFELLVFLQQGSFVLVNANWDAISNLATFALGFALGERFTNTQYAGMVLISLGLFLVQ